MIPVSARHNVRILGGGSQTIVFAHGFGCDQVMWRFVAPPFADRYSVLLFDHVGHGGAASSAFSPRRHGSLHGYAEDVLDILDALDLRKVVFVGHSVSAMIGVLASIADPSRFDKLVLVSPSPRYLDDLGYRGGFSQTDIDNLLGLLETSQQGWASTLAPVIMGNSDRPGLSEELTRSFCSTDPAIARHFARVTFLSDNRADLPKVTVPTLILQCADDVIAPECVGEYVHARIPGSRYVRLAATGHCPNLSAPVPTAAAIAAFVDGPGRPGSYSQDPMTPRRAAGG